MLVTCHNPKCCIEFKARGKNPIPGKLYFHNNQCYRQYRKNQIITHVCEREGCLNIVNTCLSRQKNDTCKFCSEECYNITQKKSIEIIKPCDRPGCKNIVKTTDLEMKAGRGKYCSTTCYYKVARNDKVKAGQKYNSLTVIKYVKVVKTGRHRWKWECKCDCGNITKVFTRDLLRGWTTTCGCKKEISGNKNHSWRGYEEISGKIWSAIKNNAASRQLVIADDLTIEWLWELFLMQNKKCALTGKPLHFFKKKHALRNNLPPENKASLDRIDNTKGYSRDNVRWVTAEHNLFRGPRTDAIYDRLCYERVNYLRQQEMTNQDSN